MRKPLMVFLLLMACIGAMAQFGCDHLVVDAEGGWEFKGLRLVPIRPKGFPGAGSANSFPNLVSFGEALAKGYIKVEERGSAAVENVHYLSVYNNSDKTVYIGGGELLMGGRQDRMVTRDTVLLPGSGRLDLPVMCVEEGRWSNKTKDFIYKGMANQRLRKVLDLTRNQVLIWKDIGRQLGEDSLVTKTFSYLARTGDKAFLQEQQSYLDYFRRQLNASDSNIVGFVAICGDSVIGMDLFANRHLLYTQSDALFHAYIDEAIRINKSPAIKDEVLAKYIESHLCDKQQQEQFLKTNGRKFMLYDKLLHLSFY
ncbi:hypothetical protein KJS94_09955 [Flavihumibacter rivuli]|uniref:ARPP-1 family domain-containing protein n=1 Tax=Flavihumibacter rivuli TaxID=2838156 RepID=UPI001BDE0635|nr:DUF6569 family protein [Flavihumibacter rivuli]ULQ54961.1 hypothetical protein KJS94_09955 [Flavihumibacter rivuli]